MDQNIKGTAWRNDPVDLRSSRTKPSRQSEAETFVREGKLFSVVLLSGTSLTECRNIEIEKQLFESSDVSFEKILK